MKREINIKFDLEEKKCRDELVGILHFDNGYFKFSTHKKYNGVIIRNLDEYCKLYGDEFRKYKKMIVILESPHIDEFEVKGLEYNAIENRPANGITGKRFRNNFEVIINNGFSSKLGNDNYLVYIVNSIQYQCSLGIPTNIFRDYVWLNLWKSDDIRNDFTARIEDIQPDVIINCCTCGSHSRNYNGEIMSLKEGTYNISVKYLVNLGYKKNNNKNKNKCILDNLDKVVIEYKLAEEITLKNLVKYQVINVQKFTGVYEELSHPVNWY